MSVFPITAALAALMSTSLAVAASAGTSDAARSGASAAVDPFIGTGGHGHTHPAATLPFGMVQLGPDTRLIGWDGCSGYHFTDSTLFGFSHTHLSGTGISDYGDVLFLPFTGEAIPAPGEAVRFAKASERAGPGWYAVSLPDADVDVELTATERTGVHRYVFPEGRDAGVLVDLAHRDRVLGSALRVVNDREIEGMRRSTGWANDQVVWFVAGFSRPIVDFELTDGGRATEQSAIEGRDLRGRFSFGIGGGDLLAYVGLSAVDVAGARANLAESVHRPFAEIAHDARTVWDDALGSLAVTGGTSAQRTIFASAQYHSLLAPNLFSDVDGRYRGMDHRIHTASGTRRYTVFSLWDTFRATHPLFTLIEPERTREFVETFLGMAREGGRLPVWELAANETDTMIGYHAVSVITDAWTKGIRGYDGNAALDAMIDSATRDHSGLDGYRREGFVSSESESESVSKTLEYAYDDWCIARMAEGLGRRDVAMRFYERAQAWRHLLDPATGFFRARRVQSWVEPFDPARVDFHYTEANAWQYGFFVPHDVEGWTEMLGGDERLVERLDALFRADSLTTGRDQADITGLIGQYAHGNEPSHHVAWLYHYAGRPDRSAARVREILDRLYTAAPDGLCGNEDCGQMSSWYVLSAIGLYPVCPGSTEWLIGAPIFDSVTLRLAGDTRFRIETEGKGHCVTRAELNGRPLPRSFLRHDEIVAGGTLRLFLRESPSDWGTAPASRPRSRGGGARIPAAPYLLGGTPTFRDSVTVEMACADPDAKVLWARAGAGSTNWTPVTEPLTFRGTTRLRLVAERAGHRSPVVEATLRRIPHDWTVTLGWPPAPQYSAGGPDALIDGLAAGLDWRTGGWHGFQGVDFEAIVDLGSTRPVRDVGAAFLQDIGSWIWLPRRIDVAISPDGATWTELPSPAVPVPEDDRRVVRQVLTSEAGGRSARLVRVRARSYGVIPDWHPGRGGQAWIFVDEVLVR